MEREHGPIARITGWAAVAAAVGGSLAMTGAVWQSGRAAATEARTPAAADPAPPPSGAEVRAALQTCLRSLHGSADTRERWAASCAANAEALAIAHRRQLECLRDAPATPDAAERWLGTCRARR